MTQVMEVLRAWLAGQGKRPAARRAGVDVKTAQRYVRAAQEAGLARDGGEAQLTDELLGLVVAAVRPSRPAGHGQSWEALAARQGEIAGWVKQDLTLVKIGELLERSGTVAPYRTLARFAAAECGYSSSRPGVTVPVADGKPGQEVQVDFGYLGMISDGDRRRKLHALVFTAVFSRYCYVFLTFSQTTAAVIAGCEAAWVFFGGMFTVVIPENVARHIFRVMCPAALCDRQKVSPDHDRDSRSLLEGTGYITQRPQGIDDSSSFTHGGNLAMLEEYFVRPQTVDRIRASWIGPQIEQYVTWLAGEGYETRCVLRRVPLVTAFGEFAAANGARQPADLPEHVSAFVAMRVSQSRDARRAQGDTLAKDIRSPVEQMLTIVIPGYEGTGRSHRADPFGETVPGFFEYLVSERGLRPASVYSYRFHLSRFEAWLGRAGVTGLHELSPPLLSAYTADRSGAGLAKTTVREGCGVLRVFLRYARREGVLSRDLAEAVEWPQAYRLSTLPRSISWEDVGRVLALPDRRTPCGKRDYAIMLLLATYGLRAREIVALNLDDIDWKRARLAIPERKAAHSTAFPLSGAAGDALAGYLRNGRPQSDDRHVFFRAMAPVRPIGGAAVSGVARRYLLLAGIDVPRPGSHTLRHSAVQRLTDNGFDLKTIGDFVGHRSPASTGIYAKVAVESLRQVALGDGEEALP